jgi:hypothetical protein
VRLASWLARLARLVRRPRGHDAAPPAARGGVVTHQVTTPPEEVEAYWTDERIREAHPREQRRDP